MASNKGRAFFAISGYHFEPTSVDDSGLRGNLDKPVISSWELSTETVTSDTRELDIYRLIDNEILKKIEPTKDNLIEICKSLNLSPRLGVELTLSVDKDESTPDVGFGSRVIKFCAEIGAFINIDYKLSDRI